MIPDVSLGGRRVLFVAPRFFGYDDDIAAELARRGAEVTRLRDRPFDTPLMTAVTKLAPAAVAKAALPRYCAVLAATPEPFDIVLVVNGQTLSGAFLTELRRHSPHATFILYLWDALGNRGSIVPNLPRYDHVLGFDRQDACAFGFRYRPLFFAPAFDGRRDEEERYDLSFIGTAHTDRAPIVRAIDADLPAEVNRFWYLFLQARWVRPYYGARSAAFRRVPSSMFHYVPLPKDAIGRVFRQSRAILDIEHPLQRGLTMRTFETLGAGKKLITTNRHVTEESFFHPDNVLVIDRHRPAIDRRFLERPFSPVCPALRRRCSLAGWLDEVLESAGPGTSLKEFAAAGRRKERRP